MSGEAQPVRFPATFGGAGTCADKSVSIRIRTAREMSPAETAQLIALNQQEVEVAIFPQASPATDPVHLCKGHKPKGGTSMAQALRNAIWGHYQREIDAGRIDEKAEDFDTFYAERMNRFIAMEKEAGR